MDKVASIQGTTSRDVLYQRNQATISGGFIGMGIGLYYGFSRHKSPLVTGFLGAIAGVIIVRLFTPKD